MPAISPGLSDVFIKKIKITSSQKRFSDGGGLFIQVSPNGTKLWRMAYRFGGKQKLLSFGAYPAISLKRTRQLRDEAKEQLAAGIDPGVHKKALKAATEIKHQNSFEVVAREWFEKNTSRWAQSNSSKVIARLENDLFPFIGSIPISDLKAPDTGKGRYLFPSIRTDQRPMSDNTLNAALRRLGY